MWVVKVNLREIYRLFQQHTPQHNIALALRLIIIRSHLFAQQHQQQPQQLTQQLSTAQVQKPITTRSLSYVQQPQQLTHRLNIAQAQKPIIIRCLLSAQQQQPPTHLLNTAQAQKLIIIRCLLSAQHPPTQLHSIAQAARRTIILIHSTALYPLLQLLVVSIMPFHLLLPTHTVSIAVPLANTTIPRLTSALTLLIVP